MTSDSATLDEGALRRLSDWFARQVPGVRGPLTAELIKAGKSNLTYHIRNGSGGQWALRRPPLGPKAPTAHDVVREHSIIAALHAHSSFGNPLADLALLVVYWAGEGPESVGPTSLPGFPDRAAVINRYADMTGRDTGDLGWYLAFSYWKLACAAEGIYARYAAGGGGGDRSVRLDEIAQIAPTLAARARAAARRSSRTKE
jgi:aminoglycoside phosphotransferase (APT) family kinase protein